MIGTLQLWRILAIAQRDFRDERSYKLRYVSGLMQLAFSAVVVYNIGKLVIAPPELAEFGYSYFDFAMIGLAVMTVAQLGISAFNRNIMREQQLGTMEVLLATTTRIPVLLAGSFVLPLVLTVIDLVLYLGLGVGVFGGGLRPFGVVMAVPLLALTLASFCSFGIFGASLVVLIKRGDPLTATADDGHGDPQWRLVPGLHTAGRSCRHWRGRSPPTTGSTGLREALLTDSGWQEVVPDLLVLLVFDVVLLPLSIAAFRRAVAVARETGTLANY